MLEHLLDLDDFEGIEDMDATAVVSAQARTASDILASLGSPEHLLSVDSATAVRDVFSKMANPSLDDARKKQSLLTLRTPQAVRHLAGMLSEYDWAFVEQAKEIRGYVVAKLLEETNHTDARIRLKALELTGRLTEVASFTDRTEVTHKTEDSGAVEERLRARLKSLLPPIQVIQDTEVKDIAVVKHIPTPADDRQTL